MKKTIEWAKVFNRTIYIFIPLLLVFNSCNFRSEKDVDLSEPNVNRNFTGSDFPTSPNVEFVRSTQVMPSVFDDENYPPLDSVIENIHEQVKGCSAKVDLYREIFTKDSVQEIYKVKTCERRVTFSTIFGIHSNIRRSFIDGKELNRRELVSINGLIPDSLNLDIDYSIAKYYTIGEKYICIISKSDQWTGKMATFNFVQCIDLTNLILYEFLKGPYTSKPDKPTFQN